MKQDQLFVYQGKLLECTSFIELKGGTTEKEWEAILKETVEFFCMMKVGTQMGPMEPEDHRVFRRLKRSIESLKKVDPVAMFHFDIDKITEEHIKYIKEGIDNAKRTMRIHQGGHIAGGDIYISNL